MSRDVCGRDTIQEYYRRPDKLAEGFLRRYIWHPDEDKPAEEYRDRHLAEYRLKWWRGGFYEWFMGRYVPVGDGDISAITTTFLQELNNGTYEPPDPPIKITRGLVENVLQNVKACVYMPDWREMNTWQPDENCQSPDRAGIITISFLNGLAMLDGVQRTAFSLSRIRQGIFRWRGCLITTTRTHGVRDGWRFWMT